MEAEPADIATPHGAKRSLNVLFFSDTYRPYVSGVVTSMDIYASQLRQLGHRVTVVAPEYPHTEEEPDVFRLPSMPLPAYPRLRLIAPVTRNVLTRLQELEPDIVHVHSPFAVGLLGLYIARACECPVVFTCHSYYEEYTRYLPPLSQPLKLVIRKYLVSYCSYCNLVIAPSHHLHELLLDIGVETPIEILPTGVDPAQADCAAAVAPRRPRSAAGQGNSSAFVLALVGRLAKEKNPDLALQVMFELARKDPRSRERWRLVVIGDGPEAPRLRTLAMELGIKSLVSFTGEVTREEVFQNLRVADAMIFTSTVETQGLAILEGMATGLPVVTADSPAARELIRDGTEGFVRPSSPDQIAEAVIRLASDPELAARMGRAARDRSREFHPALLVRKLAGIYGSLANGQPALKAHPSPNPGRAGI